MVCTEGTNCLQQPLVQNMTYSLNLDVNITTSLTSTMGTTNASNGTDYDLAEVVSMSEDTAIGLIVLFTFTTIFSIVGNGFVIIVFVRGRRSRTDLRPFLINLAISDLVMAIFCMPVTFIYTMLNEWIFSRPLCPIVLFLQLFSVSGSVFTNMAIGIDRFLAVMFPLRSRLTKQRAKYVIAAIWICAFALCSVQFYVGRTADYPDGRVDCLEQWPDHYGRKTYTVIVFVITYVIPLLILSVTYSIVGIILWKRTAPGNRDHVRDMHQLRSKRKVVKMLVIVVAMFGICWLPLHLFTLMYDFYPQFLQIASHQTLTSFFITCHWLAMANSFANPIIYGFTNESFRADLVTLFYMWFPCCVCLTKIMPRHSSGSTYETVIFRRQSLYKHNSKLNGTSNIRLARNTRTDKLCLTNGTPRKKCDYEDLNCDQNRNGTKLGENGKKVKLSIEKDYVRLEPVGGNSVSANSDPSVEETNE